MCDTTGVTSLSLRNPDLSPVGKDESHNSAHNHHHHLPPASKLTKHGNNNNNNNNNVNNNNASKDGVQSTAKQNQVGRVGLNSQLNSLRVLLVHFIISAIAKKGFLNYTIFNKTL